MLYQTLGASGLVGSRICLGTMTFGQGPMFGNVVNSINQQTANKMVDMAIAAGVNFFDTADGYTAGQAEIMLGQALKGKRPQMIVASKCGFRNGSAITDRGLSRQHMMQAVQASLKRLDTDYLDILYLHTPDPLTPLEEIAATCDDLVKQGLVRYVGISNFPAWLAQKFLSLQDQRHYQPFITAQMYYSLVGRDIENEFIPFAHHNKIGLTVWSPLAAGFLSGRYTKQNPHPQDGRRSKAEFPAVDHERGYQVVDQLKLIANAHQVSVAKVALAWILAKKTVASVVIGANRLEQLEDNLKAIDLNLSSTEMEKLNTVSKPAEAYPASFLKMTADQQMGEKLGKEKWQEAQKLFFA